ncbi:MAG TPA: sigma-70 family RNA polymerase sigma factor [Acidobacteriota bacterium]|nr:sigma-70 family RNA polymerase sigma factor [Acidobacteriota bacterium]
MQQEEWLKIYRETVHPLYGYLAKRTGGDRALTEDVVQESYLRALDSWKTKPVPETPLAWLKQVARNVLIDHMRRKRWDADTRSGGVDPRAPGDEFEALELFMAIAALGRRKARVVEAFYFDGLSVREIAAEMAVSERAVEGLLRRARGSLRAVLPDPRTEGENHA